MRRIILLVFLMALTLSFSTWVSAQEQEDGQTVHVVQRGENLYRISVRYGVSIQAIAQANGISNVNLIFSGQRLVIPTGSAPPPPPPPPDAPPPAEQTTYTVVRGDTLGNIARRFNTSVVAIAQANGIANVNLIFVGQRLVISGSAPPPSAPPGSTQPIPPAPPPAAPIAGGFELGGHVQSFAYPDLMRNSGMTWVKRQVRWNRGQSPEIARGVIEQAQGAGFKILLGVVGNPAELGQNRTQYIQEFATFLGGLAALGPDAIEVWNEPNIDREWPQGQISGANYTEMLRAAYNAIKAANPNVMVISAAPAPTGAEGAFGVARVMNDDRFLREMMAAGAGNVLDCVGIHYNEGILPPSARSGDPRGNSGHYSRYYLGMIDTYRSIVGNRPLCFTELGYLTGQGFGPLPPGFEWAANMTVQDQAEYLNSAVRIARQRGDIRMIIVWNVDFTNFGADPMAGFAIVRPDGSCPACATLRAAMQ